MLYRSTTKALFLAVALLGLAAKALSQARPGEKGGLELALPPGTPAAFPSYRGSPELSWRYMTKDADSDGDGLSDYEERQKYLTDPARADSDGDGLPDGEAGERREYTYTIEAVRELRTWYHPEAMGDGFQDVEVLSEKDGILRYRVVLYPYANERLSGDPDWKERAADPAFARLLAPSRTANWDQAMREEILRSVPVGVKTDLDLVQYLVPTWFAKRANPPSVKPGVDPVDLRVDLRGEGAYVPPASVKLFKASSSRSYPMESDEDFLLGMLFAKTMFDRRLDGACTESATYMVAVLRAAGIPARGIETNALLDFSDPRQVELLSKLRNEEIREALRREKPSYNGHHYLEAYVGGRWIKINNDWRVGVGILGTGGSTLSMKSDAYFDVADTPVSDVWRQGYPRPLPYRLVELSDRYGPHFEASRLPPPPSISPWGADIGGRKVVHLLGGREFCEGNGWRFPGIRPTRTGLQFFQASWLEEEAVFAVSAAEPYEALPEAFKALVSREQYRSATAETPFVAKLGSSIVIFAR